MDSHAHVFVDEAMGNIWKTKYDVWEYGEASEVHVSRYPGTVQDLKHVMDQAGYQHAIFLNMFSIQIEIEYELSRLAPDATEAERQIAIEAVHGTLWSRFRRRNEWGCAIAAADDTLSGMAAIDPAVGDPGDLGSLVQDLHRKYEIRGVKLHPVLQCFWPDDSRLDPVYETCRDLGLVVVSHSGPSTGSEQFAVPAAFGALLKRFPGLKLQLAHLGGGAWQATTSFAKEFPDVVFDTCEIIEWDGAPRAPSLEELALLIKEVGVHRVMMGSDFPWYDLDRTRARIDQLPVLSESEKESIMGGNAARVYGLQ